MPRAFMNCVRTSGKVRAKSVGKKRYVPLCFKGGKSFAGEVKKRKSK